LCLAYEIHVLPECTLKFRIRHDEANASGSRPETRIRGQYEFHKVLPNFKRLASFQELVKVFPRAAKYHRNAGTDLLFVLGMIALEESTFPITQLFAMDLLFEAMADPRRSAVIKKAYGFDHLDLIVLTSKYDVFSREQLSLLHGELARRSAEWQQAKIRLTDSISTAEQAVQSSQQALAAKGEQLRRARAEMNDLSDALRQRGQQLGATAKRLDAAVEQLTCVHRELHERDRQIVSARTELAVLSIERRQLQDQITPLRSQIDGRQRRITSLCSDLLSLRQSFEERNRLVGAQRAELAGLRETLEEHQQQVVTLNAELASTRERLREKDQRLDVANSQLAAVLISISWRLTAPLRYVGSGVRRAGTLARSSVRLRFAPRNAQPADARLIYSIDSLNINQGRIYGWGWMLHPEEKVTQLFFRVQSKLKTFDVPIQYGTPRPDVEQNFGDIPDARRSGFLVSGWLPPGFRKMNLCLRVQVSEGRISEIPLAIHEHPLSGNISVTGVASTKLRAPAQGLGKAARLLLALLHRAPRKLGAAVNSARYLLDSSNARRSAFIEGIEQVPPSQRRLIIDHNLGGGSNLYREHWLTDARQRGLLPVLLYYDLPSLTYCLTYAVGNDRATVHLRRLQDVAKILVATQFDEIFLSNAVSFEDPLALIEWVLSLKARTKAKLIFAVHDYFAICPSWTLLDETMSFCGVPDRARCESCLPSNQGDFTRLLDMRVTNIEDWRNGWGQLLRRADVLLCFSEASAGLLRRAYPALGPGAIQVRPHSVHYLPKVKLPVKVGVPLNIGVVGTIAAHKGANVVREMARHIASNHLPVRITVIGKIDDGTATRWEDFECLRVTGPFTQTELPDLLARHDVNICFLPSIWPETFSYVAEEIMQLGLPLAVFDLGAPAERAAHYEHGLVIQERAPAAIISRLLAFHRGFQPRQIATVAHHIPQEG
jgi:glycosyltransferase involved in cell wall biosynthesis/predicted  nucleic acid-binding Zn-ribbon protein